jgi:hypothetical protein
MKKRTLSVAVAAIALAFGMASCTKDRTCTCTSSTGGNPDVTTLKDVNKSQAKANCISYSWTDSKGNTFTETCELD